YPNRLAGERIPLAGRIVAVADVYDALTHDRPYKAAWPVAQAVAKIRRSAGSQFRPARGHRIPRDARGRQRRRARQRPPPAGERDRPSRSSEHAVG
ncbi:MAG TPA: HD domain-containing phosphohydrolase, partial [Solirubrobacteraceae bacterium]|nr:HD domain-containing phosphohydrolase [Solirubrobacteraceae bacterium]